MFRSRVHELVLVLLTSILGISFPQIVHSAVDSVSEESLKVPRIKQVAIMPVYWQLPTTSEAVQRIKQSVDKNFSSIVRSSKRFYFPNDEITAELWSHSDGRKELAESYEIDAFINLTGKLEGDILQLTLRFMSPELQNYLVESERIPLSWAAASSEEELLNRIKLLTYRTLNRYPIDVFVTSIQGAFITLSGGSQQLIFEGDELEFYQTRIKARHPVDGSWIAFEKKRLGKAKIISTHEQSSIAKLTSLAFEDAIKMGDGAVVPASTTRRAFDKPKEEVVIYKQIASTPLVTVDGGPEPSMPLPPPTPIPKIPTAPLPKTAQKPQPIERSEGPRENSPLASEKQGSEQPSPDQVIPPSEDSPQTPTQEVLPEISHPVRGPHVQIIATSTSFTFSGAASAQSQSSSLFLNNFRARTSVPLDTDIEVFGELGFGFGSTAKGDYNGFSLSAEPLYDIAALRNKAPIIDRILLGADIKYESLGVTKQTFGGWDLFTVSPSAHLQSAVVLPQENVTLDFDFNFKFSLLSSGNAGIRGKKRDLEQLSLTEWELKGALRAAPTEIEWGGILGSIAASSKAGTRTLNYETLGFGLTARFQF